MITSNELSFPRNVKETDFSTREYYKGDKGDKGDTGRSISSIEVVINGLAFEFVFHMSDGTTINSNDLPLSSSLFILNISTIDLGSSFQFVITMVDGKSYTTNPVSKLAGIGITNITSEDDDTTTTITISTSDNNSYSFTFDKPKGEKGDTGAQGIQGIQGPQGIKGDKGDKGDTGASGEVKLNSNTNIASSILSISGFTLTNNSSSTFVVLPNQDIINPGSTYTLTNDNYTIETSDQQIALVVQKSNTEANLIILNPGQKGSKGDKGDQGIQGIQGIQGLKGDTGTKGDKGDTGANGTNGKDGNNITSITLNQPTATSMSLTSGLSDGTSVNSNTITLPSTTDDTNWKKSTISTSKISPMGMITQFNRGDGTSTSSVMNFNTINGNSIMGTSDIKISGSPVSSIDFVNRTTDPKGLTLTLTQDSNTIQTAQRVLAGLKKVNNNIEAGTYINNDFISGDQLYMSVINDQPVMNDVGINYQFNIRDKVDFIPISDFSGDFAIDARSYKSTDGYYTFISDLTADITASNPDTIYVRYSDKVVAYSLIFVSHGKQIATNWNNIDRTVYQSGTIYTNTSGKAIIVLEETIA